jgi:hypothetical protein
MQNNCRASANALAEDVLTAFAEDAVITAGYHSLLDGKWTHTMDQTQLGYEYWYINPTYHIRL